MRRLTICSLLFAAATAGLGEDPPARLPAAHFHQQPTDPPWLERAVNFHGHLGPWVVAGGRLGMAGARAVDAKTHFDVDVTCEGPFVKPPESCFLDGVQIGAGATLGKRNIHYVEARRIVLKVRNTQSGKTVEVRPTQGLLDLLMPPSPKVASGGADQPAKTEAEREKEEEAVENLARDIAAMPDERILVVSPL
jgi:formylmethanofuran dehydrogenase subunit E